MNQSLPQIDVCIATYQRPALLEKLLESLVVQETAGKFNYIINVVDNDPDKSADIIIKKFENSGVCINYKQQTEKNIALTRNVSLTASSGDYIAIIDDDEYAVKTWLLHYFETLHDYDADIAHGPVERYYDADVSDFIKNSGLFDRPNYETGITTGYVRYTSNCFFKRSLLKDMEIYFDPAYGLSGGEDCEFFARLALKGARFVWCKEALVYECIPRNRGAILWILKRNFRSGITSSRWMSRHYQDKFRMQLLGHMIRLIYLTATLPLAMAWVVVTPKYFFHRISRIPYCVGVFSYLLGVRYYEYK